MTFAPVRLPMTSRRSVLSERASRLRGSSLAELFVLARAREAIDLALGTPGFPSTSPAMIEEAVRALRSGLNQYENPIGSATIRRQIAQSFRTPADPDTEITVTVGGTEALCVALLATVDPGDEVIVLQPFYEGFLSAIAIAGGRPRFVRMHPPDWRFDSDELAAAFGPATRALILNTPGNPTGRMHTSGEFAEIAQLCERWDVTVISDEVYANLVFDDRVHLSVADVPELRERSVVIGSLSKSHAISGWRLGFLRADPGRTSVFRRGHEVTTNGTAAPLQSAAGSAGLSDGDRRDNVKHLALRRDYVQDLLSRLGLTFHPVEGGCFVFADIQGVTDEDCGSYVRRLLEESAVLVVPGTPFFADETHGRHFIRIAFNRSQETLAAARRRLLP